MVRSLGLLSTMLFVVAFMQGCPPAKSFYGVWDYRDCDGVLYASVVIHRDGTLTMQTPDASGAGTWTRNGDEFGFMATVRSSPQATVVFPGWS